MDYIPKHAFFYYDSEIKKTALRLKQLLDGFEYIAKIYEKVASELTEYSEFVNVLEYITEQDHLGCRFCVGGENGAACMPTNCTMI